ncbi:MAG: protein kinase [candidate division Zixibacteria bacterium]|nr:protein kinase [candidate division Zixibacteria bacterium]
MVDERIGNYKVLEQKGAGGMAKVYLAVHKDVPNLKVILKVLSDPNLVERFRGEAGNLALLDGHPNICRIKDFFTHGEDTIIAMEYIEGAALDEIHLAGSQMRVAEAIRITIEVLDILGFAHQKGVYHRDIKPGNIMLEKSGQPKIIDFGIAKGETDPNLTAAGTACGTPTYMSPEQFTPTENTNYALVDIYAVGTTLFWLLTGDVPFKGDNEFVIRDAKMFNDPPSPRSLNSEIPKSLEKIILRALAKDPKKRYGSTEAMRDALINCDDGEITEKSTREDATMAMSTGPSISRHERNWKLITGAVAACVVVVIVAVWLFFPTTSEEQPVGWAEIDISPSADSVLFDDSLLALKAPSVTIEAVPGQYSLRLIRSGATNSPIEEMITLSANQVTELNYEFTLAETSALAIGTVRIDVSPAADSIFLDDNLIARGKTTVSVEGTAGEHRLRLVKAKATNSPIVRTVIIAADQTERIQYRFNMPVVRDVSPPPSPPPSSILGTVIVASRPRGASITLDGAKQNKETPFTFNMKAGLHIIKLEYGSQVRVDTVDVVVADTHRVVVDFDN